ncbi:thermonuclease family protein [Parasphingorhabdus sp.]|uniref:thermonuclease family protein n=1 Tax=Parasphingorhabdus sp. TaxID=2709688 RepID=UPI003A95207D
MENAPRRGGKALPKVPPPPPGFELEATGDVVDGDTIRLQNGQTARGYGFDAFESRQTGTVNGQPVALGQLSTSALDRLVTPQTSVSSTGKASFGRPVASFNNGGADVGRSQIASGLALPALDYLGQDPARGQDYVAAQREAIGAESGAYAGQYQEPAAYRKQGKAAPMVGKIPMEPDVYQEYSGLLRNSSTTPEQLQQWAATKGKTIANAPELLSFMRRNPRATVSQYWQQEDVQGAPVVKDGQNIATRHMGALNEGIVDTLGAPVDLVNMGLDAVGLPVSDKPLLGSEMIRDGFHSMGFGQIDESTAPRSDLERYTQAFARGTGQAIVPVGGSIGFGSKIANRAPSLVTRASPTRQALRTSAVDSAKAPAATALAELGGATGANVAGEYANDVAPGNVWAQLAAQTVGGLGGGYAGFKATPGRFSLPAPSKIGQSAPAGDIPPPPPGFTMERPSSIASDSGLADPSVRQRDVIDVNKVRPLLQQPTEAQLAASAQRIAPDDILPMPSNRIDGPDGADAIQAGRYAEVKPVDERSLLEGRAFQSQRNPENYLTHKGPMDLVSWVRSRGGLQEQVSGATAEAGRALQAFRIAADSRDAPANVLRGLVGSAGGPRRIQDAADAIIDLAEDPSKLNRFSEKAMKPGFKDMAVELWYNFLLSGPQTHVVNMTSNTLTALAQLPEHAVAATIGGARRALNSDAVDRVMFSELGARSAGLLQGTREGLRQMARTFRTGEPSDAVTKVEDLAQKAIPGKVGEALRIPTRALAAEDELFKAMARRMELSGLAVREAGKEGLKGKAAKDRAAELLADPTDEMLQQSFDYGRYLTFTRPLGPVGSKISGVTQDLPILKAILPFVRTPTNLFKFSIERSPLAPLMKEWRKEVAAGGARRDMALARSAVGSGFGAMMAKAAGEGYLTGAPPSDQSKERLLRADGWQPYSIKVGDKYYSYLRLDPFASTIGTAADLATMGDGMSEAQQADGATLLVASIMSNMASKTWLSGMTDFLSALDDPERNADWFLKRLAGSAAVPTGVAQAARYNDPTFRDTETTGEYIQSRIPGMGASLPSKRDFWGQPIAGEGGLGPDAISPIWESTRKNDPVTNELLRVGVRSGAPQRGDMTGHQYADFQERAGTMAKASIGAMIKTPEYEALSNDQKVKQIKDIISDSRREAKKAMFGSPAKSRPAAKRQPADIPPPPPGFQLVQ